MPFGDGRFLDEHTLCLVLPLSPSRNEMDRWHHSRALHKLSRYRRNAQIAVNAALNIAFGGDWPRPWADKVLMAVVRCSDQKRRCDVSNVQGGTKGYEDAVVASGLILDDNPKHVEWGPVEDRIKRMWGPHPGPATYLLLARAGIAPILEFMGRR